MGERSEGGTRRNQFLDFYNPVFLRSLLRDLRTVGNNLIVFEECLPSINDFGSIGSLTSAEEFLFEVNLVE